MITMLQGIRIKDLKRYFDERGSSNEIFRRDMPDMFEEEIVQTNMNVTYPGIVRAWHMHRMGQVDYYFLVRGVMKICAFDDDSNELDEFFLSGQLPQILRVPGKYWHGFKAIGNEPAVLVYFTSRLYDYANPDEARRSWNDQNMIPKLVNGHTNDPRVGKVWDWYSPPHK